MERSLTDEERSILLKWLDVGNRPVQRRALILLQHEKGHPVRAIADEVGLSARQVRRWLAAFREKRMGIFPKLNHEKEPKDVPAESPVPTDEMAGAGVRRPLTDIVPAPVTVQELWEHNQVDLEQATHVKELALRLFDLTAEVHHLSSDHRSLLETAAMLHDLGRRQGRAKSHRIGRDLILAQPIVGLDRVERDMLACIVAFQRKKVRPKREEAFGRLGADLQHAALVLAALLRVATGLNASMTRSTAIRRVETQNGRIVVVVEGPEVEGDSAVAQRRSDLWSELFPVHMLVATESQLIRSTPLIDFGQAGVPLPELASPGLIPEDPMNEAGRKTLLFHFLRMIKHEAGTRAGEDIEELHDMRVATRRMRAAVRVFGDFFDPQVFRPFAKGIRRVTRVLGPVRDLDVFEEKAGHYLAGLPESSRADLDPLLETWREERKTARERMIAYLDSERYRDFKQVFGEFLQTEGSGALPYSRELPVPYQVRHVAPRLIYTRYEKVRAYETVLDGAQIETLHALRIDCKYLRYTLEFFREVLDPEIEDVISEVKAMQDHLGDLNDADVAIRLLNDFLRDWDDMEAGVPLSERRSVEGVVTYLAARHAEKHRLLTTFPEAWNQLNRAEVRRWLALAVAAL